MSLSSRVTRLARVMLLAHLLAGALVIALENHLPGRPFFRSDEDGTADDPALLARSQAWGSDLDIAVPLCSRDVPSCGGWASEFQGRATHLIRAFQTQWRRSGCSALQSCVLARQAVDCLQVIRLTGQRDSAGTESGATRLKGRG